MIIIIIIIIIITIIIFSTLLFYCYTTYITENKHINMNTSANNDIENVVRRKGLLSILLFILLF